MKYPLPNNPQFTVQKYLGRSVGEMLLDPTARVTLNNMSAPKLMALGAVTGSANLDLSVATDFTMSLASKCSRKYSLCSRNRTINALINI